MTPAAAAAGVFLYTGVMEKGMHVWGVLAAIAVAAVSVYVYMGMPQAQSKPMQDGPLPVLTSGIQLDVALTRPPLPQAQQAALDVLAANDAGAVARPDPMPMAHFGPGAEVPLGTTEQVQLDAEIAAATVAAAGLDTPQKALAAGYTQASRELAGIGSHWVNWTLIDKPFDPAKPSMLLYATIGGVQKLVGYSYFVQSDTEPKGFAGQNDMWHRHGSLCIVNGWLVGEGEGKAECPGTWLYASKLWMMHAWVAPGFENPWGLFGMMNPNVCPDGLKCSELKGVQSSTPETQHKHTHGV